jgi:nitrate/TMAO reductase-like tetraheme cytochrome c subunit
VLQRFVRWFASRPVWLIVVIVVVFLFLFFLASVELLHYSESTAFCTSCHTMHPEKTVYEISPHQNVDCGTCHIGPGAVPAVQAKLSSLRYLWSYPLNLYERPIPSPVKSLRPVEVVCEQCHWPQKFYTDRLMEVSRFAEDEANSRARIYLLLKTGGGSGREGLGKGIHWHIENDVRYRATDEQLQDIPWVEVEVDGGTTEYVASDTTLTEEEIAALPVREMDCIDCHNRATHVFPSPSDAIDVAMERGQLDPSLPHLKREAVRLLEPLYESHGVAAETIASELESFYTTEHPEIEQTVVEEAATALAGLYQQIKFPEMETDWRAHRDNIGHKDYPGCFRCHDGQHFSSEGESIRLECNICHNIPKVVAEGDPPPLISPAKAIPEPASHQDTNWIARHRVEFDQTCSVCHDTSNAGGADDSSFCANSACHGTKWVFAGLDAPGILEVSRPTQDIADQAAPMPHPVKGQEDCLLCHGPDGVRPFPADHDGRGNEYCTGCHVAPPEPTPTPTKTVAEPMPEAEDLPSIPHPLEGRDDCLLCHGLGGVKPFPADHEGRTTETCLSCHQVVLSTEAEEAHEEEPEAEGDEEKDEGPPSIPHTLEGRDDCLLCHNLDGVKPFPADHERRTPVMCPACHQLGSEGDD